MNASERAGYVARAGLIAGLYAAATIATALLLQGLAWGPIQFRVSEALVVLACLTPAAVPGLTIGCVIANLFIMVFTGSGALGLFDVVLGSTATFVGALWCWKMRDHVAIALLGPVVANAAIVSAYLPILLAGVGFYTIPFTSISLDGLLGAMYLFGFVFVGLGEAVVVYGLGWPLLKMAKPVFDRDGESGAGAKS